MTVSDIYYIIISNLVWYNFVVYDSSISEECTGYKR